MSELTFRVDRGWAGKRLDLFLHAMLPKKSRAFVQRLIEEGLVKREDVVLTKYSQKVSLGDIVMTSVELPVRQTVEAEDLPITVVYEDEHLAVLDKPAGMVVHPAPGHRTGTLVNALLHHFSGKLSGVGGQKRPGLVHRLDRNVSGLILIAKDDEAHGKLQALFKDREVEKLYLAVAWGKLRESHGRIDAPIGRHPVLRKKMAVIEDPIRSPSDYLASRPRSRPSLTLWRMLEHLGKAATLLEMNLKTGRTHQIRVHLSHIHHPIVGDPAYGGGIPGGMKDEELLAVLKGFDRIALHAWRLSFKHPAFGRYVSFEAAIPDEFRALLTAFRAAAKRAKEA